MEPESASLFESFGVGEVVAVAGGPSELHIDWNAVRRFSRWNLDHLACVVEINLVARGSEEARFLKEGFLGFYITDPGDGPISFKLQLV